MASKTVYASSYNYDRSIRWNTTSWAKVTQDSDSAAYNGGWASRVGGGFGTTTRQWVTWIPFPTKTSFLDSSKWEITAATFYLYQGYAGVSNLNNIPGCMTTLRVRGGTLTPSGTNAFTHTAGTGTTTTHLASQTDVGYKQYQFSLLDTAKALQSGSATGIYVDLQDSYNTTFYSRLYSNYNSSGRAYNTTQSPRFVITYQGKQFKITYNANGGSGAPSATTYRYATSGTTNLSSTKPTRTGYTFLGWSQSSTATSASYSAGQAWSLTNNANYTLYAVWSKNSYYLDLNGWLDGASSGGISGYGTADVYINGSRVAAGVSDYYTQHPYGSTYEIKNIVATTGHTYNGVYSGSVSGTIGAGAVTVTLKFSTNSYTLTIDPNGGTWGGTTSDSTATQNYNTTKSIAAPTRTGYTFAGWFKTAYGSLNNSRNTHPCFYGQNNEVGVYNNNGNGVVTHTIQSDASAGYQYTLKITTSTNSASPGYGGFYTQLTSAASKTYIHCFRAKVPSGYSLWHASNAVGNGSSFEWLTDNTGTGAWKNYAYKLTTGSSGTFSTFGYVYMIASGSLPVTWYLGGTQITTSPTSAQTFTYGAGNTTLQAQWVPQKFTITYDANGGTGGPPASETGYYNSYYISSSIPTKTGYTFTGWKDTYNGQIFQPGAKYPDGWMGNGMVAQWSPNQAYITYNPNGGSVSVEGYGYNDSGWITQNGNVYFHNVPYGTSDDPYNATTFGLTKTGYDFDGKWYLYNAAEGITSTGLDQDTAYSSTTYYSQENKNITSENTSVYCYLYAGWTPKTLKLTLDANGGSGGTSAIWYKYGTNTFYSDSGCTTTITKITAPTRTGYTYTHYYGDGSSGGSADEKYINQDGTFTTDLVTDIYKDATLYALWTANTYTIAYNANSGSGTMSSSSHTYDTVANLTTNTFTKAGYEFAGWNTKADGTGTSYTDGQSVKNLTSTNGGNITLYAQWEPKGLLRVGANIYIPFVYKNNTWVQVIPYGYHNGEWKIGG